MAFCGTPTRFAKPSRASIEFRASSPQAHIGATKICDNSRFSNVSKSHLQDTRTRWRNAQTSPLTSSGRSLVSTLFVGRDGAADRSLYR
jgi:hypothetical protein